ncbi:hypothetical protein DMB42_43135 [Nonomuraea sp. WAC 01424]|uniref:non-ribosomal peptide synthetase n=1 Tax=Nonomuraea sp. WAC 01424 TaxID=2203200 RepID=UPI000F767B0A|nr:non-ribosomal peptide synthetase [Nonomuraea sp. WAC 01424]RSM99140.1 hypothetical protein DMB42_43135 [Nonomuraea sp. WAC 01424]
MEHNERVTETVVRLLAEVLPGGADLTPDASLKDSGLDSISAVRVWFEIQREFSLDFPVERLGGCGTPAELAELITELIAEPAGTAEGTVPAGPVIEAAPGERHEPFPLTPLQQAYVMGTDEDATPDPVGCQVYREFEVPGVDPERLRAAWQRVVDHHDALRLELGAGGSQRVLERAPSWDLPVDEPGARERLAHRRYEPGVWPPFAVEVTTPGTVHFGIDASVTDGRGLDVLMRDWWRCYRDPGHRLEEAGHSVRDCLLALEAQRRGPRHQEDLDYWRERLADLPPGPAAGTPDGSPRTALTGSLTAAQWSALRARAAELDVSPTALVLTLFAETVGRGEDCSLAVTTTGRAWLPREVDEVVGPFTGTAVFAVESTLGEPLEEAVREVHRRLWRDLGHAAVPGVTVMRELRERTALPVVFTSLLDARPDEAVPPVSYALSQTSGVALDHQMWELDGELRLRWDLVPGCFAPGEPETLFARFTNALRALAADAGEAETRPLNELQKAYYVARAGGSCRYDGCQVYHSFHVRDLDRDRLERAWLRLVAAYDALRSEVTHDGTLRVRPCAPENWNIPETGGADDEQPASAERTAEEMAGRAFPLGRWPQWELRVSGETVHAAVDLTVLDGRSIHIVLRELFRLYADPSADPRPSPGVRASDEAGPSVEARPSDEVGGAPAGPRGDGYWQERFRDLPPGPEVATTPARRVRLSGSVAAVSDETVFAALAGALGRRFPDPFSVSVVRWTAESEPLRPGEFTALSWVTDEESYPDRIAADAANGALTGLATLRGHVMRERRHRAYAFPVVYTSTLDLTAYPLPDGVEAGPWLTYTPDVALDCIVIREGDRLHYHWDALEPEFPDLAELFAAFEDRLRPAHRLFERQAAARPDAVALRHAGGTMTYGELNRRANAAAWRLKELDVGPGTVVGVRLCRGPDMVAAVLGILKAGGAYLPVEPSLPDERAAVMLDDAAARIVLTRAETSGWAVPDGVRTVELDDGPEDSTEDSTDDRGDPPLVNTVDDLAYVIFTSGSTGKPKGVEVSHRPLLNLLDWCYRMFDFDESDVGLCVTSLGFDLSVFDIFGLLGRGASLYIADEGQQRDPELLLDVLIDEPVTFWNSAPTTLNQLARLLAERQGERGTGDLRLVFLSGDYTPLPLPDAVRATFPRARVVSLGGATEATVWSNWYEVGQIDPSWRSIPYGRPIDDALYYILDEDRRPCPEGEEGDLYIGGRCLSLGYRNQPELTAERFVPDPFAGGRMYLTGDRAALLSDGNITFLGRADNQVKIRGFRVELGEIEHRLRQHPGVRDVVVLARDDPSGERKLVAYVMAEGAEPDVGELRTHAAGTLPAYMVPNHVAFVRTFPATSNGKLDRDALPWPLTAQAPDPVPEAEPEPEPVGVGEEVVAEIAELFAELLGVEEVDAEQDLWDQGVTSFTMVQVSKALRKRYGRRVPVALLLENPTVTGIAAVAGDSPRPSAQKQPPEKHPVEESAVPEKPAESAEPGEVDFFSAEDREAFKAGRWNLRPLEPDATLVRLDRIDVPEEHFAWRASVRDFGPGSLPYRSLCRLLRPPPGRGLGDRARHLYPSAGDTYAVQAYLHVTRGAIDGVAEGVYYYNPNEHALQLVNARPENDRSVHFVYNRDLYDRAGFTLYLIGQTKGIEPLYGEQSLRYLTLEAGYLGQLLMTGQAACGIGLCPIGDVAFDRIRDQFDLDEGHHFLQAFLGGPADHATGGTAPTFAPATAAEPVPATAPASATGPATRPAGLAVIGMAGRYPGADDLDGFWHNLRTGARSLGPNPRGERPGGYLEHIDRFDSLRFHVSPQEAVTLDPQLRLLLHSVWECLEHAGHTPASLHATAPRVGVFVGSMWHDYQHAGAAAWRAGGPAVVSATASDMVNRVSYFFGFTGPSIAVDTSCSSTLTALHLAAQAIRTGDCDAAVVAGVNLLADPYHAGLLAGLGLLAEEAGAAAFDADRPGWTVGEGVGSFLLRPVADAVRAGDDVHGVVEATWVAHTGRTGRFTAPSATAMAESMRQALDRAGAGPGDISYVECAAADAALADAAEAEALTEVFGGRAEPVAAGTLKPNIGHLEAASGASQLAKVLLQIRHGRLAPTLLAEPPTDAVTVPEEPRPWTGERRRALVNAFGATGTHAHAVVRAPLPEESPGGVPGDGREHAVLVSAATGEQLVTAVRRLAAGTAEAGAASGGGEPGLSRVAYTTQTGRAALAHRLAVLCRDVAGLREGLEAFAAGRAHPSVLTGDAAHPGGGTEEAEAAAAWVAGQEVDWERFWPEPPGRVALPAGPSEGEPYWIERAEPVAARVDTGEMEEYLKGVYAEVSGIAADRLGVRVPLEQYGLTSYQIGLLNARLEQDLGERSRTLFFEHGDLAGVAAALSARPPAPRPEQSEPPEPSEQPESPGRPGPGTTEPDDDGAVAVIGIAGRYPDAPDLATFWENLAAGRHSLSRVPDGRTRDGWPVDLMWGGFLDGVTDFDPLLFGITPRDAALMDPQERVFLEVTWEALEDAGYPRTRLRDRYGSNVAVYAGVMYNEYPFFGVEQSLRGTPQDTGATLGGVANRVSYHLDLKGPSMSVDTMCSSSLAALHLAVRSLRQGECELAIAGGVNLNLHPNKFVQHARMRLTAGDRRCHSFGAGGDGFVPAEGAGAVLLKPLSRAKADGDRIHAVIRGTAVVHSGRTNGWVVPSPVEEAELVARALADAGVDPAGIGYLECHGAGTALGDPIEINALMRVFGQAGAAPGSIPIGSVKSNLGHVESGAGIAGLTKIVLQLRHRRLAPSLHADELNPDIRWDEIPFRVQREAADWPEGPGGAPRRAGISSFGAGGTIAHAVLEEPPPPEAGAGEAGAQLVVLSAHDEKRLRVMAGRLAAHLRATPERLADVAHTLQIGREPLRERLALVATEVGELCERLERFARSEPADVLHGRVRTAAPPLVRPDDLLELGRHWVDGGDVDWTPRPGARVVGLPTYPFDRMRCWPFEPAASPEPTTPEPIGPETPLFERVWTACDRPASDPGTLGGGGVVCLFNDASEELARSLGEQVVLVREGDPVPDGFTGWIDLCDLGEAHPGRELERLATLQDALARRQPLTILHVTSGLLDLDGARPSLAGARMAGFVRMLAAEYPTVKATVLDSDRPSAPQIRAEWAADEPYGEVCHRDGGRFRPGLRELPAPYAEPDLDPEAVYVVSGGTRGLGALVARHLAGRGARRLARPGGRPLPPRDQWDGSGEEAVATVLGLERMGARVVVHTGPPSGLAAFLEGVRRELGPIGGVVHCAGRSSQGRPSLAHKSQDDLRAVLAPKADLLEALDEACAEDRPAFFVTFSSVCAAVPALAAGVADYAAANTFLDLYTGVGRRSGRPEFRSVDWPQWRESGGARGKPNVCEPVGLAALDDRDGLRVLDRVIGLPRGATVLPCPPAGAEVDVPALLRLPERAERRTVPEPARDAGSAGPDWLAVLFSETIGIPVDALDPAAEFGDLGVESVMLAELVQRIEERLGESLEPSLLLDHPTLDQLRDHLDLPDEPTQATPEPAPESVPEPAPEAVAVEAPAEDRRIAIIGMACRLPGAPDVATFWRNLVAGRCDVREVPASRWDHREFYSPEPALGRSVSKWGGFVEGIEDFDNDYFDLGEDEARALDPAIRLFLECCAACLADAGYQPAELRGRRAGVFAGARMSDYGRRVGVRPGGLASDQNFIAARVAHHFDLRGPNLVVDSACSSSLVGVQLAAQSLLAGEAEVALAGGVEVLLDENDYLQLSAAKALSPTGRCHTFDERADGFVPGEGCGVVLLKPLRAARVDGDRVHAVIEAVAVNNDGRTMGVTTPNPEAQADVVRRALAAAGRAPREIGLIEAHGTGTLIGDPIELRALTRVFGEGGGDPGTCAIGSVKTNIGHTLSAAGIAGLIKTALAVEHGRIPPTLSCERPNPRFDFGASPFEPATETREWPSPRVAGVSSFGLGGTNAHLVLSELDPRLRARRQREPAPAPVFRRRRLWLERDPAPALTSDPGPDPGPPDDAGSLLDLHITTGRR